MTQRPNKSRCNANTRVLLLPSNFVCYSQPESSCKIFWDSEGVLLLEFMPHKKTITGDTCASIMVALRENIKQNRREKLLTGVLLLHDKSSAQKSRTSLAAIRKCGFAEFKDPPYSPDLAPSDYFLFRNLKNFCVGDDFPITIQSTKL